MDKKPRTTLLLCVLLFISSLFLPCPQFLVPTSESTGEAAPRYAFIGTSLTFTHDIPGLIQRLSQEEGASSVKTKDLSQPGWPLIWHLDRGTLSQLGDQSWTGVVIQEQSWESLHAPERAQSSIRTIAAELRKKGIQGYLFESSIGSWSNEERAKVRLFFAEVAKAEGLQLLPVTSLWENLRSEHLPSPYGADNHHPSPFGSFSAAAVILRRLNGTALRSLRCDRSAPPEILLEFIFPRRAVELTQAECDTLLRHVNAL
jgi:hypothetical protein